MRRKSNGSAASARRKGAAKSAVAIAARKIRTYNYPQGRVTDHRIGYSNFNLPAVMDGALDTFIDQLATQRQAQQLAAGGVD